MGEEGGFTGKAACRPWPGMAAFPWLNLQSAVLKNNIAGIFDVAAENFLNSGNHAKTG